MKYYADRIVKIVDGKINQIEVIDQAVKNQHRDSLNEALLEG